MGALGADRLLFKCRRKKLRKGRSMLKRTNYISIGKRSDFTAEPADCIVLYRRIIMNGKKLTAALLTAGLLTAFGAPAGPALAAASFKSGCVVREWEADQTPSYRVGDSEKCRKLDLQLDGGDGPRRGRVRETFRSVNRTSRLKRTN